MEISTFSSVSSNISATYSKNTGKDGSVTESMEAKESKSTASASHFSDEAAVYEKSSDKDKVTAKPEKQDRTAIIKQLQEETERLKNNLLDIVRKSITGQGSAFALSTGEEDLWKIIAGGNFTADADAIAKAKEDISEDGYWGVEKTSSRIVDFAITLSGGDTSKAELLINAFKKGYEQATGVWGKDLPDISSKTYDAVMEKFDGWKNGTYPPAETQE